MERSDGERAAGLYVPRLTSTVRAWPRLSTERLLLRAFVATDAAAVERLAGEWKVAETTLNIPHPYPPGAAAEWIASQEPAWESGDRLTLAICDAGAPDEVIGAISLAVNAEHARGELGYWIGTEYWGRGYATEAARALVAFGFDHLRLNRIQARHFARNPASGRVLQKAGLQCEGVHRQMYRRWDRFEDTYMYAILASDAPPPE